MGNNKNSKTRRNRLLIALGCVGIIVASFFIYKYVYIYTERKKYDAATVAIQKVASDLRAQGIETEFTKGCGRTQELYTEGTLTCSVGFSYSGDETKLSVIKLMQIMEKSITQNSFIYQAEYNSKYKTSPSPTGSSVYKINNTGIQCNVTLTNNWNEETTYSTYLSCSEKSKFKLF